MPIGVGAGLALAGIAGAGATAAGSIIGSNASASSQKRGIRALKQMFQTGENALQPFISGTSPLMAPLEAVAGGTSPALAPLQQVAQGQGPTMGPLGDIAKMAPDQARALLSALGLGPKTMADTFGGSIGGGGASLLSTFQPSMQGLAATPGYQFTLRQGELAASNPMIAAGLGGSGALGKGLINYAGGLASSTYNQQLQNYLAQNAQAFNMLYGPFNAFNQAAGQYGQIGAGAAGQLGSIVGGAAGTLGGIGGDVAKALMGGATTTGANLASGYTNIGQTIGAGIAGAGQAIGAAIPGAASAYTFGPMLQNLYTNMGNYYGAGGGAGTPSAAASSPAAAAGGVLSPIVSPAGTSWTNPIMMPNFYSGAGGTGAY
jgi:hypothetical protein